MLGMGLWLAVRRKKPAAASTLEPFRGGPIAPTLGDAIDAVRRIAEKPPRDHAGIREAHFIVAEAVRRFVEERWEVPASRQTTEEFLSAVAARGDIGRFGPGTGMLPAILEACDRVKWAGDAVGPDDTAQLARTALELFAASRAAIRGLGGPDAGLAVERRS